MKRADTLMGEAEAFDPMGGYDDPMGGSFDPMGGDYDDAEKAPLMMEEIPETEE